MSKFHKRHSTVSESVDLSQFPDEPIQFIQIDDKGKCKINHSAFDMLSRINTKIAVICVAGPYRTGKSFLLNRLLGRQDGFEIGSTVQSCTKGLWIWGRPIRVSEQKTLFFITYSSDYQGNQTNKYILSLSISQFKLFAWCLKKS